MPDTVSPLANQGRGELTWAILNSMMPAASVQLGTLERKWDEASAHAEQIWAVRFFLDRERRVRDRALFDFAIDSKLRGCDLVKIRIGDVVAGPEIRTRAIVIQQKTGRPVQFEITGDVRASLLVWLERRGGTVEDYAFPSWIDHARHMSTRQYARLVDEWVTAIAEENGRQDRRRTA